MAWRSKKSKATDEDLDPYDAPNLAQAIVRLHARHERQGGPVTARTLIEQTDELHRLEQFFRDNGRF